MRSTATASRNPQRFSWDSKNRNMILADIGQNMVEKVSLVSAGANLGWNIWEGDFRYGPGRDITLENPRSQAGVTYPFVEYDHTDPLLLPLVAITGVYAYRQTTVRALTNKLIFGDNPSGEIFYIDADNLREGQAGRRFAGSSSTTRAPRRRCCSSFRRRTRCKAERTWRRAPTCGSGSGRKDRTS